MADTKSASRSIYIDQTSAERALEKLTGNMSRLENAIKKGTSAGKDMTKEIEKLANTKNDIKQVQDAIDKGLKPTFRQQQALVRELDRSLKNMSESAPGYAAKFKAYETASAEFNRMKAKINEVNVAQNEMGNGFTRAFTRIAQYAAAYFAFDQVKSFLSDAIDEAEQAEKATSRLKNTLDNLGRGDAFDRITAKADELAKSFKFLDNDDITEVFQQLITYGKLTEAQMNELLPVIINFAAKSGISVNESASVIIKAMEGNAKALKEYGINVKDGSTVTERFGILMTELKPKVEGAAEAFGDTFAGKAAIARQEVANLKEDIGTKLIPVLAKLYSFVSTSLTALTKGFEFIRDGYKDIYSGGLLNFGTTFTNRAKAAARQTEVEKIANSIVQSREKVAVIDKKILDLQGQYQSALSKEDKDTADRLKKYIDAYKLASDTLKADAKAKANNTTLGGGDPNEDPAAATKAEAAAKKAEAARKKAADDAKKTIADFNDFVRELNNALVDSLTPDALNEALALSRKFEAEIEKLNKMTGLSPDQRAKGLSLINENNKAAWQKLFEKDVLGGKKDKVEVPILVMPKIEEEDERVVAAAMQKVLKKIKKDTNFFTKEDAAKAIETYLGFASEVVSIWGSINQAKESRENAQFNRELKQNDIRKREVKRLEDSKVITAGEASRRITAIEQDEDKKKEALEKKQFERNKRQQMAQAAINGALAITNIWATTPKVDFGISTYIMLGLSAIATLASIASIAAQEFAEGGKVKPIGNGKVNSGRRNIPTQPNGDDVYATVRVGEVVLNERQQRALGGPDTFRRIGVPGFAHGGRVKPFWESRPFQSLDYAGLARSQQIVRFAEGGRVMQPATTSQQQQAAQPIIIETKDEEMKQLVKMLLVRLSKPIEANVSHKKLKDADDFENRVLGDAALS